MFKKIARFVLTIHLILIGLLLGGSPLPSSKRKPLVIKTVTISPKPREEKRTPSSSVKTPSPSITSPPVAKKTPPNTPKKTPPPPTPSVAKKKPASSPPPPQKATTAKTTPPKPSPSKPAPTPKKSPSPPSPTAKTPPLTSPQLAQLNESLRESIKKMESSSATSAAPKTTTPSAPTLHIDRIEEATSSDYAQTITHYLHQSLHLPDFGEVKIQLTLQQDGHIVKLVVLEAENERNKKYLEEMLPYLRLPPFVGSMAKQKECTLILTFCNEL